MGRPIATGPYDTMTDQPISEYALLSDSHSAALVSRVGSVDWLCFPRFDSPSVFGRLLGPDAGYFSIRPVGDAEVHRRYRERTLVLETTFRTAAGVVRLAVALAVGPTDRGHGLGAGAPHALLRTVELLKGHAEIDLHLSPRPEYGITRPLLCTTPDGVTTRGGPDAVALSSPVELTASDGSVSARFTIETGERVAFALQWSRSWDAPPRSWSQDEIVSTLDATEEAWRSWADMHQTYDGYQAELVLHSGRVLQALTFQPTGAIVAAPTTSLPERVGGVRNWDYRYSWVRDTSLTLDALWVAACPDEVSDYVRWMVGAAAGDLRAGGHLQIMFGVGGEHDLTERQLAHLPGWRDSRPVRVGNAAWQQEQLDVYGELLGAVHRLAEQIGDLDQPTCDFLVGLADAAAAGWREPDQGMWEVRSGPQHFLHSKLMCWYALDRAVGLAGRLGVTDGAQEWKVVADDIRNAIVERGYDADIGAFTQAFGSRVLDASALMIPIVGFLEVTDERVESTIQAIEQHLTDDRGLVYRYQGADDGLPGDEGTFLLCTFWLAQCHALAGRVDRAKEVFDLAAGYRNDVDLLAEEVDPATGELLGNFPQAFSHIGLVNAAWAIDRAQSARPRPPAPPRCRREQTSGPHSLSFRGGPGSASKERCVHTVTDASADGTLAMISPPWRRARGVVLLVVGVLLAAACGDDGGQATGGTEVRAFNEVQESEFAFEADPLDPTRGLFRVETTAPMICAIVWGETDEYGRFNNFLSMNGTGIVDHDVLLPEIEPGRTYHFIVQRTTADGTLYRSEPGTFTIETSGPSVEDEPTADLGENVAPSGTVVEVSSEFSAAFAGELAIDGDLATEWSSAGDGDEGHITIDLGSQQRIAAVEFVTRSMADGSAVTTTFTVTIDGGAPLGPFTAASPATSRLAEIDATGRLFRFDVGESTGGNVGAVEIRLSTPRA